MGEQCKAFKRPESVQDQCRAATACPARSLCVKVAIAGWRHRADRPVLQASSETTAELQSLLRAEDWQSLASLPARLSCAELEPRGDAKSASISRSEPTGFCQRSAAGPGGLAKICEPGPACHSASICPLCPLQDIFKQWLSAWTPATQDPLGQEQQSVPEVGNRLAQPAKDSGALPPAGPTGQPGPPFTKNPMFSAFCE